METTLYLIRHGDTEGTQKRLFYGSTDLPLAEEGRVQVRKLRERGIYPPATDAALFTSGMIRTEQTFELIYGDLHHSVVHELREIDLGHFEMTTVEEMLADEQGRAWLEGRRPTMDFPGGDSSEGFARRVEQGLSRIRKTLRERDVIAVLHGAVIFTSMELLFPGVQENPWRWTPEPAGGYAVTFRGDLPQAYRALV